MIVKSQSHEELLTLEAELVKNTLQSQCVN